MFCDTRRSVSGLNHLTEKMTSVASLNHVGVVVDHTLAT